MATFKPAITTPKDCCKPLSVFPAISPNTMNAFVAPIIKSVSPPPAPASPPDTTSKNFKNSPLITFDAVALTL